VKYSGKRPLKSNIGDSTAFLYLNVFYVHNPNPIPILKECYLKVLGEEEAQLSLQQMPEETSVRLLLQFMAQTHQS